MVWGLTSRLRFLSMVSRSLFLGKSPEMVLGGKLYLSVSRVITMPVICAVFPFVVSLNASHCA